MPNRRISRTPAGDAQRRQAAVKHGAAAAEVAITKGQDFTGLAAEQEQVVSAELDQVGGLAGIVRRGAVRLQVVADLYYGAILGAEDMPHMDLLVKRYGWLQASALRAWAHYAEVEKRERVQDITDLLSGGSDENDD